MQRPSHIFTSESVSEGHPDKVADRISDTVVDAFLGADPFARVACETMVTTNRIIIAGEVRGPAGVVEGLEDKIRAAVATYLTPDHVLVTVTTPATAPAAGATP